MRWCVRASGYYKRNETCKNKSFETERKKIKETQVQRNETISSLDETELKCVTAYYSKIK